MQSLRLMPSVTYFHKKMDEFGLDHDKGIRKNVLNEAKRKSKPKCEKAKPISAQTITSEDALNSASDVGTGNEQQDSTSNGKRIIDSFAKIVSGNELDAEPPCLEKHFWCIHTDNLPILRIPMRCRERVPS